MVDDGAVFILDGERAFACPLSVDPAQGHMDTVADFEGVVGRVAFGDGQVLRRCAIAEGNNELVAVPAVTIAVVEFEDDVAGIFQDDAAFGAQATVGLQGEADGDLLRLGAVGIDLDVEHTGGRAIRIDGADLDGVALDGDIFALAGDGGDGIGSHVVTNVLEIGHQGHGLARDETTSPRSVVVGEDGLASGDVGSSVPRLATIGHLDVDLEIGAVFNTFGDDEAESVLQGDGLFGGQNAKFGGVLGDVHTLVGASQGDGGDAVGRVNADILESHAQVGFLVDGSEVGRVAVDGHEGAFGRQHFHGDDLGHFVVAHHGQRGGANVGHGREFEGG